MDFNDYINSVVEPNQKDSTVLFYKLFSDFNSLYETIKTDGKLLRSIGDYTSKISFVFNDEKEYNDCLKALNRIMPVYKIKIYDVLSLFYNKGTDDDLKIIINEIQIQHPSVIYVFNNNKLLKEMTNVIQQTNPGIFIISVNNIKEMLDNNDSHKIFDTFKYLVTFS